MDFRVYDHEKIQELILEIKGPDRSFDQLAKDAGISPSGLSQVYSGYYRATARFIKYITAMKANPNGMVTEEEMLDAAGLYRKKEKLPFTPIERKDSDGILELYGHTSLVDLMDMVIGDALTEKYKLGYLNSVATDKKSLTAPNCAYFVINKETDEYMKWWFFFMHPVSRGTNARTKEGNQAYRYAGGRQRRLSNMTSFFKLPLDPERKITLVYEDAEEYDRVLSEYATNSYRGNLSIALVNLKSRQIICEDVLATYEQEEDLFKLE